MFNAIDTTVAAPFKAAPMPEVINHTPWPSQNFQHIDPVGDVYHVMVTRVSYSLVGMDLQPGQLPVPRLLPASEQGELVTEDEYQGRINSTSVVQESDFAPYKPMCDVVLVNAVAYAPHGKPAKRWSVGFRLGDALVKRLQVTGPRSYQRGALGGWKLGVPQPALSVPLCYELAFGGPNIVAARNAATTDEEDARFPAYYEPNPIGAGRLGGRDTRNWIDTQRKRFKQSESQEALDEELLQYTLNAQGRYRGPQIEEHKRAYKNAENDYPVIGVGPIARWWLPRRRYAGTHDEKWKETQWPKSPKDHDYRYWNCAPEDQQIAYPQGGEAIVMANLTPHPGPDDGLVRFALPSENLQTLVRLQSGPLLMMPMHMDTVIIDFAQSRLSTVCRVLVPADLEVRKLEIGTWDNEPNALATQGASLASSANSY